MEQEVTRAGRPEHRGRRQILGAADRIASTFSVTGKGHEAKLTPLLVRPPMPSYTNPPRKTLGWAVLRPGQGHRKPPSRELDDEA